MKAIVIIPTYNERENIRKLVLEILDILPGIFILIIDDNSPNGTGKIVQQLANEYKVVQIIHRQQKLGLGTAYLEGFSYALKAGFGYILTMDADSSHDPKYLPCFLKELKKYDLVVGSRYIKDGGIVNWPIKRIVLSKFANFYARLITGLKIKDCTAGFLGYQRKTLENINLNKLHSNGYAFLIEMKYRIQKKGFKIKEIPIVFFERRQGKSKISHKTIWEAIFLVWKLRLDRN